MRDPGAWHCGVRVPKGGDVDCEVIGLHTTLSFGLLCRGHEEVHAYDSFY